jgi:hypothetical protein
MRCPRCEGTLETFDLEAAGESAVVCDSCGFAGVPASHRSEDEETESWEQAIARFDETVSPPERTCQTGRGETVRAPTGADQSLDPARLEESVSVAVSLRSGEPDGQNERTG